MGVSELAKRFARRQSTPKKVVADARKRARALALFGRKNSKTSPLKNSAKVGRPAGGVPVLPKFTVAAMLNLCRKHEQQARSNKRPTPPSKKARPAVAPKPKLIVLRGKKSPYKSPTKRAAFQINFQKKKQSPISVTKVRLRVVPGARVIQKDNKSSPRRSPNLGNRSSLRQSKKRRSAYVLFGSMPSTVRRAVVFIGSSYGRALSGTPSFFEETQSAAAMNAMEQSLGSSSRLTPTVKNFNVAAAIFKRYLETRGSAVLQMHVCFRQQSGRSWDHLKTSMPINEYLCLRDAFKAISVIASQYPNAKTAQAKLVPLLTPSLTGGKSSDKTRSVVSDLMRTV